MPRIYVWIMGVAFLVLGMALTVGPALEAEDTRRLEAVGVETAATVTDVSIIERGRRAGGTEVRVDIEYSDEFGLPLQEGIQFCGEPQEVRIGDQIEIIYDPDDVYDTEDDDLVRHTGCGFVKEPLLLTVIGGVALAAGAFLVLWAWAKGGWGGRKTAIALAVIGGILVAASFSEDCECRPMVYFSATLTLIGVVAFVGGLRKQPE